MKKINTKIRILISCTLVLIMILALTVSATSSGEVNFETCTFETIANFDTTGVNLGGPWAGRGTVSLAQYVSNIDAVKLTYTSDGSNWQNNFAQSTIPTVSTTYQTLYDNGARGIYFYVHNDTGFSLKLYPHVLNQNGSVTWVSLVQNANCYLISEDNLKSSKIVTASGNGINVPADFRGYLVFPFTSMGNADGNSASTSIVADNVLGDISAGKFGLYSKTVSNVQPATGENFYLFNYGSYKPNNLAANYYSFADFNIVNWPTGQFASWPGTPSVNGYMEQVVYDSNDALRLTFGSAGSTKLCQFAAIDAFATAYGNNTIGEASPSDKTGFYIKIHNNSSKIINYSMKFLNSNVWYTNTVGSNLLLVSSSDLANPISIKVVLNSGIAIPAGFLGYIVIPYNTISADNDSITSTLPISGNTTDAIYQRSFGGIFNAGNVTFTTGEYLYIIDYGAYKPTPAGPDPIEYNVSHPEIGTIPTLNKSQAQQVAANILTAPKPNIGDTVLANLSLPSGYSATIYTTDYPGMIASNGTITQPDNFTLAKVVYEITKSGEAEKGYSNPLKVLIPARKRVIDSNYYTNNVYSEKIADFETNINGYELWGNASGLPDPAITRETTAPIRGIGALKVVLPSGFETGWIGIQSVNLPGTVKSYDGIVIRMKTNTTKRTALRAYIGQGANNYDFNLNVIVTDTKGNKITTENAGEVFGDSFFLPSNFDGYIFMPKRTGFDTTQTSSIRIWFQAGDTLNGFNGATVNIDDIDYYSATTTTSAIINDVCGIIPNTLSNLRYGLMVHLVANNNTLDAGVGLVGPNGEDLGGISNYTNVHDVDAIVNDIADMQFEYVCITDFHGMGISISPNAALDYYRGEGVYSSKRDLLGEFITGLKNKGIYVMLMTHPLDGHDYPLEERTALGWYDSTNNYERWNSFIDDAYADIVSRYSSDLVGISFDSEFGLSGNSEWTDKLNVTRLRDTIRSYSNVPLLSLVPANQLTNFSIKEVWRPSWLDPWMSRSETVYDVEDWPAYYRSASVVTTDHWTTISTRANSYFYLTGTKLYRYMVLQTCVATDGPGVMWGTTPYFDGQWELGVREAFLEVGAKIALVKESLQNVIPSKSYIRREGAKLSTLPNGIAATSSFDGQYEYIHVLNYPGGNVLNLPAPTDGRKFNAAFALNTNHPVDLFQATDGAITLTLQAGETWDSVDTVIRLTNTIINAKNLALFKPVMYSSSIESTNLSHSGWGNARVVDGNTAYVPITESWSFALFGWSSIVRASQLSGGVSEWVTVDLKSAFTVNTVNLYPRSDTGNENLGFPTNFTIQTSLDNVNWTASVTKTNYAKPNGKQSFTFTSINARYVKVNATALARVPEVTGSYYFQLGEIEVAGT